MAIRIDASSSAVLLNRWVAYCTFTKGDYKRQYYKIQWQNIRNDIRAIFRHPLRIAPKLAYSFAALFLIAQGLHDDARILAFGGAIAFDAASNSSGVDQTDVSSLTFAHTCTSTDATGIIMVGASFRHDTGSGKTVTGVTYEGVALTSVGSDVNVWSGEDYTSLWRLISPTEGTNNVIVTYSTTVNYAGAGAVSYTGVDQTSPIGTPATADAATGDPTVDVSSAVGELVVDSCIADSGSMTVGADQTQRVQTNPGTPTISHGQSEEAGAATVTMSWDQTDSDVWAIVGVSLKPAAAVAASAAVPRRRMLMGVGQ